METGKKRSVLLFYCLILLMIFVVVFISTNERMTSAISGKISDTLKINFKPNQSNQRQKVRLVIGILSWFKKHDRRKASRSTWLQLANNRSDEVAYSYFCDNFDRKLAENQIIVEEERLYKDMVYFPFRGWVFSNNQVYMMRYFAARYDFDYFMKIDDDYFVCLDRLLFDMSYLNVKDDHKRIWWGWGHCTGVSTWIDEGMNILTTDIVKELVEKYDDGTLMCSFMADLSIGTWLQESPRNTLHFYDNARIVHQASNQDVENILKTDVCQRYLSIHQAYPERMYRYWKQATLKGRQTSFDKVRIEGFKFYCSHKRIVNLNAFKGTEWHKPPKPCSDIPTWGGYALNTNIYRENGK